MGRPRKDGRLLMDTDLRIPVTREQKAMISEATADEPEGLAAWARSVLLAEAKRRISRPKNTSAPERSARPQTVET